MTERFSELSKQMWNPGAFNFSTSSEQQSDIVLFGVPMDYTVSFKSGSRFGPAQIRNASYGLEEYSPYLDRHLSEVAFHDSGDIVLPFGNAQKSLDIIYDKTKQYLDEGKKTLILGGEHLITYPIIKAYTEKYPDLILIQFDAHTDLRDTFFDEKLSHATVMRRCVEMLQPKSLYQYGIRSGERHEWIYAEKMTNMRRYTVLEALKNDLAQFKDRPIYITLDIDVVDPAFCPGTGTQEACGITTTELLQSLHALSGLNIVGMDLVEVSPPMDHAGETVITAAKLVRESILSFWWKNRGEAFEREALLEKQDEEQCTSHAKK